jgi:1,4-alpha-glucan branching enzyme
MKWSIITSFFLIIIGEKLNAQVVSPDPTFPSLQDNITLTFDATLGNKGLQGFQGTVYAHTGLITEQSTSGSDWKYVQGTWGTNNAPIMTKISENKYTLNIGDIYSFYGAPKTEKILQIAILFRSENGETTGRNTGGSDIFINLYDDGFYTQLASPTSNTIYELGNNIELKGFASSSATMKLFVNGTKVKEEIGDSIVYAYQPPTDGDYEVVLTAQNGSDLVHDTVNFIVFNGPEKSDLPISTKLGIVKVSPTSLLLSLFAPNKKHVHVIGDFNQWDLKSDYSMKLDSDNSTWWIYINDLDPTRKYAFQYLVDGEIKIADPYSELVADSWNDKYISADVYPNPYLIKPGTFTGYATILDMAKKEYDWKDGSFKAPDEHKLIIYELLVRDFLEYHSYTSLYDTLDYLTNLGINAIELMPVNEFEGNESWGYNPSYHGALDKYYGTPNDFKKLVDACHERGIAVILDVVFNHGFSQNPLCQLYWDSKNNKPDANNPFVNANAKHDFNVGYDFNHESPAFKAYMKQNLEYWTNEYHIDGYRFDLSKGFTQNNTLGDVSAWGRYDLSRVNNIKRIFNEVRAVNPDSYIILEHFADNSEEKDLANFGCMFWGNISHDAMESSMGYNRSFNWANHQSRGWNNPKLIAYAQSHDEERMMYKNLEFGNISGSYSVKDFNTALDRLELTWVVFNSIPGPKLIWQFSELGYDYSIDYNGRVGNKPIKWEYNTASNRKDVYTVFSEVNKLKTNYPAFDGNDFSSDLYDKVKRIQLNHTDQNFLVLGNFDVVNQSVVPNFKHTGVWYEYFSGDSMDVQDLDSELNLSAGEYQIWTDKKIQADKEIGRVKSPSLIIDIYPNPGEENITVSSNELISSYEIIDSQGKIIDELSLNIPSSEVNVNVNNLPKGIYFIRVTKGSKIGLAKFIR